MGSSPLESGTSTLQAAVTIAEGASLLREGSRVRRHVSTAVMLAPLVQVAWKWHKSRTAIEPWSISVSADDDVYPDLHRWVLQQIPEDQRRALTVSTSRSGASSSSESTEPMTMSESVSGVGRRREATRSVLTYFYDSSKTVYVELDGHRVSVEVETPNNGENAGGKMVVVDRSSGWAVRPDVMTFTAIDVEGRLAIERFIQRVADARIEEPSPRTYLGTRWGDWARRQDLPTRELSTVFMADGIVERVVDDLKRFFASEDAYARLGWPYHRGILLHGPPGGGKTSLVRGIATEFGMDAYLMSLGDISSDSELLGMISRVSPGSLVLIEDVDTIAVSHDREQREESSDDEVTDDRVTLSGFLNAIDGVSTPHGVVFVLSTNRMEVLDPALLRPGRVDLDVLIGPMEADQAQRVVELALPGSDVMVIALAEGTSAAAIVEACKRALHEPERLAEHLREAGAAVRTRVAA